MQSSGINKNLVIETEITQPQTASACTLIALAVLEAIHMNGLNDHAMIEMICKNAQDIFEERNKRIHEDFKNRLRELGVTPGNTRERIIQQAVSSDITNDQQIFAGLGIDEAIQLLPLVLSRLPLAISGSKKEAINIGKQHELQYQRTGTNKVELRQELIDSINLYFNAGDNDFLKGEAITAINAKDPQETITLFMTEGAEKEAVMQLIDGVIDVQDLENQNQLNAQNNYYLTTQLKAGANFFMIAGGHTIVLGNKDDTYFSFDSNTGKLTTSNNLEAFLKAHAQRLVGAVQVYPARINEQLLRQDTSQIEEHPKIEITHKPALSLPKQEGFFSRHAAAIRFAAMIGSYIGFFIGIIVGIPFVPFTFGGSIIAGAIVGAFVGAGIGFVIGSIGCALDNRAKKTKSGVKSERYSSTSRMFEITPPSPKNVVSQVQTAVKKPTDQKPRVKTQDSQQKNVEKEKKYQP